MLPWKHPNHPSLRSIALLAPGVQARDTYAVKAAHESGVVVEQTLALGTSAPFGGLGSVRDRVVALASRACLDAAQSPEHRLDAIGHAALVEDLHWHLEFLFAAVSEGDAAVFGDYLGWHTSVAASRGWPAQALSRSLDALGDALASTLDESHAAMALQVLRVGKARLDTRVAPPSYDRACPEPWLESADFAEALLRGDRRKAERLFDLACARAGSLPDAEVHVIHPAMVDIGRRWQHNQVTVAQEHLATAIAQTLMAQSFGRSAMAPPIGRSAVLACPAGNHHTLGLRMVADALEAAGWTTAYLGADTPTGSLVEQVQDLRPDLIALSASLPHHLRPLRQAIASLRGSLGAACPPIGIGGLVFNQFPGLARSVDAEHLGANALDAVEAARRVARVARE